MKDCLPHWTWGILNQSKPTTFLASLGLSVLLAAAIVSTPQAIANHTQRTEWETHGGADNIGGLRANIKVQSPNISSYGNLKLPCTHTMVVAHQAVHGFMAAGWLKYKDASGATQIRGLAFFKDYVTGSSLYVLGNTVTSGTTYLFQAKKQDYGSGTDCWYAITPGYTDSRCFNDFAWGHPRVIGRLNDNIVTSGTDKGTFTSVKNRAHTSETWVSMGSSAQESFCIDTSYTNIHGHQDINGYFTFHIGPPFPAPETNTCSASLPDPTDLGG